MNVCHYYSVLRGVLCLEREAGSLEAPFLVPSESPWLRSQNSLMHSITAQPDPSPARS